jgi:hypothetical protein
MTTTQWPQHDTQGQFHVLAFAGPDSYAEEDTLADTVVHRSSLRQCTAYAIVSQRRAITRRRGPLDRRIASLVAS